MGGFLYTRSMRKTLCWSELSSARCRARGGVWSVYIWRMCPDWNYMMLIPSKKSQLSTCQHVNGRPGQCRWMGKPWQHLHGVIKYQRRLYARLIHLSCKSIQSCIEVDFLDKSDTCLRLIYQSKSKVCIYPNRRRALNNWINHFKFLPSIRSPKITSIAVHPGFMCKSRRATYHNFRKNTPGTSRSLSRPFS